MTSMSEFAVDPVVAAYDFAPFQTIVDVGGGRREVAPGDHRGDPGARGVLHDLPRVVEGAPDLLQRYAVADRVRVEGGSFMDAVPKAATSMCSRTSSTIGRTRMP